MIESHPSRRWGTFFLSNCFSFSRSRVADIPRDLVGCIRYFFHHYFHPTNVAYAKRLNEQKRDFSPLLTIVIVVDFVNLGWPYLHWSSLANRLKKQQSCFRCRFFQPVRRSRVFLVDECLCQKRS